MQKLKDLQPPNPEEEKEKQDLLESRKKNLKEVLTEVLSKKENQPGSKKEG